MQYTFKKIDEPCAQQIVTWRYDPPYDYYNPDPDRAKQNIQRFLDRPEDYAGIYDEHRQLMGYCCFGAEAQVTGGNYTDGALDIGVGLHPDLTGKGNGKAFFSAILDFSATKRSPGAFRVSVAEFNHRAIRLYVNMGFAKTDRFISRIDGRAFIQMICPV